MPLDHLCLAEVRLRSADGWKAGEGLDGVTQVLSDEVSGPGSPVLQVGDAVLDSDAS